MSFARIPWRDNGLWLATLGGLLFAALIGLELVFQELHYQDPVLNYALQSDSETDDEEDDDELIALTDAEKNQVKSLLKQLTAVADDSFDWPAFKQTHPAIPVRVWQQVAYAASRQQHFQAAEQIFQNLLTEDPGSETLLFQYAKAASHAGDDTLAVERYKKLLDINPNHQAGAINLGLLLARLDRHREAVSELTKAIQLISGHRKAKAFSIRASSYAALGDDVAALEDFNVSLEYRPTHAPTWRKLAKAMLSAGVSDEEALAALNRSLKLKPDSVIGLHDRGRFYWLQGEMELAREDLETIRAIAPDYQPSRWTLLQLYVAMDKENSANKAIKWLRQQNPGPREAKLLKGIEHFVDDEFERAQTIFAEAFADNKRDAWALYYLARSHTQLAKPLHDAVLRPLNALLHDQWMSALATQALAEFYAAQGQADDAITLMQNLSSSHPQSHYYAYLLGRIYLDAELPLEAASALQRAVKLNNRDTQTQLSLAIAYNRAGQVDLASKTYENILKLDANHREALYNYANILEDLDRNEEAIEKFERLLSFDTDNNNARYLLARLYLEQEDFQLGIGLLREALAEQATYHRARELLAEAHARRGDLQTALAEVDRLLILDGERFSALLLKSDILRDLGQLQAAADALWAIPRHNYSRNTLIKLYNIGKRALDADNLTLAQACNRSVVELDPAFDKAWVNLSSALLRGQRYNDVVTLLQDKSELMAINPKIAINLAEAHHYNGQSRRAIALLEPLQQRKLLSREGQLVLAKSYRAQ